MKDILQQVIAGRHLSRDAARDAFTRIMAGQVDPPVLGAFLCALATKGEHVDEIVGAAEAMRHAATRVHCERPCLCTCGTGGDGISTFNVSTTSAFIASAAGVVVAKHGNRTNTRVSGSAEVLGALGINVDAAVPILERCLRELGLAFLHAPRLHTAMKHAVPVRKAICSRTIFNLLGPLCNPACAAHQVLGVSRPAHVDLMAEALRALGTRRSWVVHGADGLCDLSISGPTEVAEIVDGRVRKFAIHPADAGLNPAPLESLLIGSAEESAAAVRAILSGERGPRRDHALLNAAAALLIYGLAEDLREGTAIAAEAIDSGAANRQLAALTRMTRSHQSPEAPAEGMGDVHDPRRTP